MYVSQTTKSIHIYVLFASCLRVNNEDQFVCYIFDYTSGMIPISFTFGIGGKITLT